MASLTLTFDNGPSPEVTPFVLDALAERGLDAYFFVVGRQIDQPGGRELVRRIADAGHVVGNHTMTHDEPLGLADDGSHVAEEIAATQQLLLDLGVVADPPLFRPFGLGGKLGPHLLSAPATDHLVEHGYSVVLWNSVPRDWELPTEWLELAWADLRAHDHTVMVLHDLPTGAMYALPAFLDRVLADQIPVTLDLPDSCLPIQAGVPQPDLARYVASDGR